MWIEIRVFLVKLKRSLCGLITIKKNSIISLYMLVCIVGTIYLSLCMYFKNNNVYEFLDINSIIELANNSHYQIACTKYFEFVHGEAPSNTINHPNHYFSESINLAKNKQKKNWVLVLFKFNYFTIIIFISFKDVM